MASMALCLADLLLMDEPRAQGGRCVVGAIVPLMAVDICLCKQPLYARARAALKHAYKGSRRKNLAGAGAPAPKPCHPGLRHNNAGKKSAHNRSVKKVRRARRLAAARCARRTPST